MAQASKQHAPSQDISHAEGAIAIGPPVSAEGQPVRAELKRTSTQVSSPLRDAWRRYRRNWPAMASLIVVLLLLVWGIFAPFMRTSDPLAIYTGSNLHLLNAGPSPSHWFGTDGVGRDIYSRIAFGSRVYYLVGFIGTLITVVIGSILGVTAGYFGGAVDSIISRVTDIFLAFPAFLLTLLGAALFGQSLDPVFGYASGRVVLLTIIFALVSWPALTRFVRSMGLSMREQQYVEASRTAGSGSWKIIFRHLLPNMWGLILVQGALLSVGIIYNQATLTIFGLGVPLPNPDPGQMLLDGSNGLNTASASYLFGQLPGVVSEVIFPGLFFTILLLALTFIGDGVRDAVDPRMNA